jgi:hypothetical protein
MDGPDSFGTPPSYHKTLSGDLGLIHRARRGFGYRDFTTCENEGSCPLVSRVPKRRNLFTLNRFGVSYIPGFHDWRKRGVLPFGFPGAETPKPIHAKPIRGFVYLALGFPRISRLSENEGSYPLVSRVPKRRNLFTLNRFGVSYTGISRLVKMRGLTLWFPGCRNAETYSR